MSIKGDYSRALEYFFKGVPLAEKINDKRRLSSLYIDISLTYKSLDNPDEQIQYIRKAEAALPDKGSPMYHYMIGQVQSVLAWYFLNQHQPDSALYYARAMIETNRYLKSLVYEAVARTLSGSAHEQLGNKDSAELYFKKAISLTDTMKHAYSKFVAKTAYTGFLLRNNKIEASREQARQLLETGQQINNSDFKLAAAGFLRMVYDSLHQPDSAYFYSRLESAFRDTVYSREKINRIQSMAFHEQLRVMEEETKRAADAEQRKQNIQYALIALGITLFIIFFLVLSRSFIIHTKVIEFFGVIALLIVFEFLNLLLHPFLEGVTRHSPLWMLLALVCIAALLVPLHHRLQKIITHKLVEKNKKLRRTAADPVLYEEPEG